MARPGRTRRHRRVREAAAPRYAAEPGLVEVLYDSDIIIDILRTAIAWAEIFAGIRPGEEPITQAFFEARGEIVLDGRVGRHAGAYLARYAGSHGVELADALVAAAATTSGVRLWTLNRKNYPMPDIRFYDG